MRVGLQATEAQASRSSVDIMAPVGRTSEAALDRYTRAERSQIMRLVKGENTEPEMVVRRILHDMGFRFRIHRRDLPGRPDVVLPRGTMPFWLG